MNNGRFTRRGIKNKDDGFTFDETWTGTQPVRPPTRRQFIAGAGGASRTGGGGLYETFKSKEDGRGRGRLYV